MIKSCAVCTKNVLSHSPHLYCHKCFNVVHLCCLHNVSKNDTLYTLRDDNIWYCPNCIQDTLPFVWMDDDSFYDTILHFERSEKHVSLEELNKKVFIPFEINDETQMSPLFEIDPDLQYFNVFANRLSCCDYHLEDSFNKKCRDLRIDQTCFSLLHTNIRSVPKNLINFTNYLDLLCIKFSVIGLTETWLQENNVDCYGIEGYKTVNKYRSARQGGGVSLFIVDRLPYILRDDLVYMNDHIECLFIELEGTSVDSDKNYVVGIVYRPPNTNINMFNDTFSHILSTIKCENKKCYIMGDYNINLLNCDKHSPTEDFINTMFLHSFFPTINKPTRVTATSATLIDNIFSNDFEQESLFHGIFYTDISDHYPIFFIDSSKKIKNEQKEIKFRDFSHRNVSCFLDKLHSVDWGPVLCCTDPAHAYTTFHGEFIRVYNSSFPMKVCKSKYKNKKTWLTVAIKNSIKTKNKLYFLSKKYPNHENIEKYKYYRNKLNSLIRSCERKHYESLFHDHQTNLRKKWTLIKEIINKKKTSSFPSTIKINNKKINDESIIADCFNKYFVNIGPQLASSIKSNKDSPLQYMNDSNPNTMFLHPVTHDEVKSIINNMNSSSPGWDRISGKIIKATYQAFISPLTHVLNLSLSCGTFPDELKIAKVLPLFKSGDVFICPNYRPISILPFFSKIFEKVIYKRLLSFIKNNDILYYLQFGFREGRSTGMALVNLVDKIVNSLDKEESALTIFLDFSKAFDTVDHSILFSKLEHYGIRGLALSLIKSYLTNRFQYVEVNGCESSKLPITCGVPQGSILGPLLFLLYVNDIANVSNIFMTTIFADDTNLFYSGTNIKDMIQTANTEMEKVVVWLQCNKLSLNINKSNYMLFTNKHILMDMNVRIENQYIERVKSTKFLGIMIDDRLSWKDHIMIIKKKISRGIGIINKAKKVLNSNCLMDLYYSFIYPYLCYGIEVWGNACNIHLLPLLKLQKKIVRMITNSKYLAPSNPLFERLHILKVAKIYVVQTQMYMHKFLLNKLPSLFNHMFTRNSAIHSYITRQIDHFHLPRCRTDIFKRSFRYMCVKLYNNLESKVDYSKKCFKKNLKLHLLAND